MATKNNTKEKKVASQSCRGSVLVQEFHDEAATLGVAEVSPTNGCPYIRAVNPAGGAATPRGHIAASASNHALASDIGTALSVPGNGSILIDVRGLDGISFTTAMIVLRTW